MKCRKREGEIFVAWSPTPPPIAPFLLLSALFHFQSLLAEIDRKNGGTIWRNGQQKSFSIKDGGENISAAQIQGVFRVIQINFPSEKWIEREKGEARTKEQKICKEEDRRDKERERGKEKASLPQSPKGTEGETIYSFLFLCLQMAVFFSLLQLRTKRAKSKAQQTFDSTCNRVHTFSFCMGRTFDSATKRSPFFGMNKETRQDTLAG